MKPVISCFSKTILIIFLLSSSAGPVEAGDISIPDSLTVESTRLILNGVGLRKKFGLKAYYAALYLPRKTTRANDIVNAKETQAIVMTWIRSADTRKIQLVFLKSLALSAGLPEQKIFTMESDFGLYSKQITDLVSWLSETGVKKDYKWSMVYLPEKGVDVYIDNGESVVFKGTLPGHEFKRILWSLWLGDKEIVGKRMTNGMLGIQ